MTSEKILDIYECFFYSQHGENGLKMCKYYPYFCNKCPEPIKVKTIIESEE